MAYPRTLSLFIFLTFMLCMVRAQDKDKTQSPKYNCLGGPAFGLEAACDFNNFEGLQGHSASEILYEIIMQADRPNDTFYPNEEHVTCLFKDTNFILDFGVGAKGVGLNIGIDHPGSMFSLPSILPVMIN